MIFGKPPDHLIKVATLIKDFWRLWDDYYYDYYDYHDYYHYYYYSCYYYYYCGSLPGGDFYHGVFPSAGTSTSSSSKSRCSSCFTAAAAGNRICRKMWFF